MTRAGRYSMASIPRSNSAPLMPPAGSSTVSSANRIAERGPNHPQIPRTRPDFESVLDESEHGTKPLLTIDNLPFGPARRWIGILTHVNLWNWLTPDHR